jgi:hypothetical protein
MNFDLNDFESQTMPQFGKRCQECTVCEYSIVLSCPEVLIGQHFEPIYNEKFIVFSLTTITVL